MKLYQPVLFVGLGGTGCDIGAGLERRLREEICGPDGNSFRERPGMSALAPYQLPSCIQFVYADMNQAELDRITRLAAPGAQYAPVAAMTAHYSQYLAPRAASYPELARNLRMQAMRETETWLPPSQEGEPRVNPLSRGAGQLPTVGRAALFGSILNGVAPLLDDIQTAVSKMFKSSGELQALGGRPPTAVDVFVAFSVAGGTGAGVFYDYLHLIGLALSNSSLRAKIWPLVLMPSAFEEGLGGGRNAQLNAGRALLDLFRLVDEQNDPPGEFDLHRMGPGLPTGSEDVAVHYPVTGRIAMPPGTVQTGILFTRPAGATHNDMLQAIASLVMSLIGIEITDEDRRSGSVPQSFADSFINEARVRQARAENGIGNRGVSTALVSSMTVPVDELAGIVAAWLLREAVGRIMTPDPATDSTRTDIEEFLIKAGVHPLLQRNRIDFTEPAPPVGALGVTAALNDRRESMSTGIGELRAKLHRDVPDLVDHFDPTGAARSMLTRMDAFRLQWVVSGHQGLRDSVERGGVSGLLQHRRRAPLTPTGQGPTPPLPPEPKDRLLRKMQWSDEVAVAARSQQDIWYRWQTNVAWAEAWDLSSRRWIPLLEQVQRELAALARAFAEFARQNKEDFPRRSDDLYRRRLGISYLLPAGAGIEQLYTQVFEGIRQRKADEGEPLQTNSNAADVLKALVGVDAWADVYELSVRESPETAVSYLRERVKTAIKTFLRDTRPGEQSVLPRLHDLLAEASGPGRSVSGPAVPQDYLDEFEGKLAGLLPSSFTPQGSGLLKILVSYPANIRDERTERYLKSAINLPPGILNFRNTQTESISVVLFRTGMGLTEVGEVRGLLRQWLRALAHPGRNDMLPWRQRTGYHFGYLATREEHRVEILQRILSALWNGKGTVEGTPDSPIKLSIRLAGGDTMQLPLVPLRHASSWGSLLHAYELWALDDDEAQLRFSPQLMRELPEGLTGSVRPPHALYVTVRAMASGQIELLDELLGKQEPDKGRTALMRAFWAEILPAALDLPFNTSEAPIAGNLRSLERTVGLTVPP